MEPSSERVKSNYIKIKTNFINLIHILIVGLLIIDVM